MVKQVVEDRVSDGVMACPRIGLAMAQARTVGPDGREQQGCKGGA